MRGYARSLYDLDGDWLHDVIADGAQRGLPKDVDGVHDFVEDRVPPRTAYRHRGGRRKAQT